MKAVALGGAVLASGAASAARSRKAPKVLHQVFFWLKNPDSAADRDALIAGLRTLRKVPVLRRLEIGIPASTAQRGVVDGSFSVSALMAFDSVADEKVYQDHPIHRAFVSKCEHLWGKVLVYDSMAV